MENFIPVQWVERNPKKRKIMEVHLNFSYHKEALPNHINDSCLISEISNILRFSKRTVYLKMEK